MLRVHGAEFLRTRESTPPARIDRARHRRKKATAKCHMRLNIVSFLPAFAVVADDEHHDSTKALAGRFLVRHAGLPQRGVADRLC